jgi:hypothetical protein
MVWTCPQCGATVDASADRCWACKQPRPEPDTGSQKLSVPVSEPDPDVAPGDEITESASKTTLASGSLRPLAPRSEISATQSWTCSKCGEAVDAGFQVCWSCGTSIEGVEDPSFVSADKMAIGDDEPQASFVSADEPAIRNDEPQESTFLDDVQEQPESDTASRPCIRCQGPLEPGFVADFQHGRNAMSPSEWVAGTPQSSFWTGTWTGDRRYPIQALRCTRCGHLEFWADEPSENA